MKEDIIGKSPSRWLPVLVGLTIVHTTAFIAVTSYSYWAAQYLASRDATLRNGIAMLQQRMREGGLVDGHTAVRQVYDNSGDPTNIDQPGNTNLQGRHKVAKRQLGLFADMLKAQEEIFERHCHNKTKVCPAGSRGDKGSTGDTGIQGGPGPVGSPGMTGPGGPWGQPGVTGPRGDSGAPGDPGPDGRAGSDGVKGLHGEPGTHGLSGPVGANGSTGSAGPKGERGDGGGLGPPGHPGIPGPQGSQGPAGSPGSRGEAGLQGSSGQTATNNSTGCDCMTLPKFDSPQDEMIRVDVNGTYRLPCSAHGNPAPALTVSKVTPAPPGRRAVQQTGQTPLTQ